MELGLSKVSVHNLIFGLHSNGCIEWLFDWNTAHSIADIDSVFGEENSAWDEVYATANNVSGCELWAVVTTFTASSKETTIISVISIGNCIPARQTIQVYIFFAQTDSQIPGVTFADNQDFKIIYSAVSWNRIIAPNRCRFFLWIAFALNGCEINTL